MLEKLHQGQSVLVRPVGVEVFRPTPRPIVVVGGAKRLPSGCSDLLTAFRSTLPANAGTVKCPLRVPS